MASSAHAPLTPRQLAFAEMIARGGRIGAAALAAGYSTRYTGTRLLRDPRVQEHVAAVRERLVAEMDAETLARFTAATSGGAR